MRVFTVNCSVFVIFWDRLFKLYVVTFFQMVVLQTLHMGVAYIYTYIYIFAMGIERKKKSKTPVLSGMRMEKITPWYAYLLD